MNDQLQAQLSRILAQIIVSVGEVKDFSVAQLPDIVQQYIQYGIYSSIFYSVISFLVFIVCVIGSHKVLRYIKQKGRDDDGIFLFNSFFIAIGLVGIVAFIVNIHSLIMVLTAPKVWFILEIKNLLS
jgi:hypothetical protein